MTPLINITVKTLLYPWFLECCHYTKDSFWENIFENLAYGVAPYGTYITKDSICCSYKKKEFSYTIERKDPEIIYNEVYALLHDRLGLMSPKQRASKRTEFDTSLLSGEYVSWGKIRKKIVKNLLIEQYVLKMKKKYNLSPLQAKNLLSLISVYFSFKVIGNKDVEYKNGEILDIKGIQFENGYVIPNRHLHTTKVSIEEDTSPSSYHMADNWKKYIKGVEKT